MSTNPTDMATVDDRNPWLGLASFTEETRAWFHGREEEVGELARRVQRKLLTVLFGQSGLGKTSILRAGLVPRLRAQGFCPVYVRVDYGRGTPEPAEQIKRAIMRTAADAGAWSQAGVAIEGESLWEFLHHRDDVLKDAAGQVLTPLLIFDQFEEIFTLAQGDDFGRTRAAHFIEELADLCENRPPRSLEARLEQDDGAAERFDFARGDYRVLISLREDYLAPLEGLKKAMPSISQNRLRLAPMTGDQALQAVLQPGKQLVNAEVAAAIVRFVAGGAELANAEVEPSLLSLICRELNDARISQGRPEISLDLLDGSHATILGNFYERALGDQLPAVRHVIEDDLLTGTGYRENVAEERLQARRQARWPRSSTGGCCASRSASTCGASSSRTTCCAAWSRPAATCGASARRSRPPNAGWPNRPRASVLRTMPWCARARSRRCAWCWRCAPSWARATRGSARNVPSAPNSWPRPRATMRSTCSATSPTISCASSRASGS
jgi:hypothetical protein